MPTYHFHNKQILNSSRKAQRGMATTKPLITQVYQLLGIILSTHTRYGYTDCQSLEESLSHLVINLRTLQVQYPEAELQWRPHLCIIILSSIHTKAYYITYIHHSLGEKRRHWKMRSASEGNEKWNLTFDLPVLHLTIYTIQITISNYIQNIARSQHIKTQQKGCLLP